MVLQELPILTNNGLRTVGDGDILTNQTSKQYRAIIGPPAKRHLNVNSVKITSFENSIISGSSAAKIECPRDWKRHENSCYYFGQESVSWLDAAVSMNIGFLETSWSNRVDID